MCGFSVMARIVKNIRSFFSEMIGELKKSTWPNKKELGRSTLIVVIGMFLISFYISVVDFSLLNVVDFVSKCVRN
ncbi:MAG: preprotein translocase subunit SecE [Puniceicoccales bacterium]|jgi:preprotein translocase subunit SecE|nr:preprotein translocase subunit SecE [Puniceicoccales bacterium]